MGSLVPIISIFCGAVVLCKGWEIPYAGQNGMNPFKKSEIPDPVDTAQTVGNPLPSAFFEEQITTGRHPDDDKRYTIEQLNHAARHRNVYYDTVGGDPYGHSSPVLTRSHIAVPHKKKRSLMQQETSQNLVGSQLPSAFFQEQVIAGRHPDDDKRYTVEQLNHAARHRNVYYDMVGGDPYGNSSPVLTRSHIAVPHKKRRSVSQAELVAAPGAISQYYPAVQSSLPSVQPAEKRDRIARLNYAARHRNVYFDSVGGDPYGSSSPVLTRQHILIHHNKRSAEEQEMKAEKTLKEKLRLD